jgi:membrane-bound inhibitor of C-type lysozyme
MMCQYSIDIQNPSSYTPNVKKQCLINIMAFVVSVSLIVGISTASAAEQNPVEVYIKGSDIFYTGQISPDGYRLLRERTAAAVTNPTRIVINSGGGPIENGLDVGNWLYDNGLDILVIEKCMSSCANYVFPAAKNKEISDGAVVAWHGSLLSPIDDSELEESLKFVDRQYPDLPVAQREKMKEKARTSFAHYKKIQTVRQKEFFEKIGVDENVTLLGPSHGAEDFYFLSVEDMKRFGITNVTASADYTRTDLTRIRKKKPIVLIELKEHARDALLPMPSVHANSRESTATYLSSTGESLTASYDRRADSVTLNLPDGSTVRLPWAISGSGARYANDRTIFWEHQGKVSVWIGEKLIFKGTPASKIP